MRIPTPADFSALNDWGIIANPMAAIDDFSEEKAKHRQENERHCRAREEYEADQSDLFVEDTQAYYRTLERPIDRTKWEYLKQRKAWFHPPVGWDEFSSPGVSRILDLGCGDGDITQLVADHIAANWLRAGYDGFPLEVVGIDLNDTRVRNARRHTSSPHEKITLRFEEADVLEGLNYEDNYFDYTLLVGLLEVLTDDQLSTVLAETTRLTATGVYIRDILEEYPGITPRPDLPSLLSARGFTVEARHRVFEEPFTQSGSKDPLEIWPMNINQVLFARLRDTAPPDVRY